MTGHGYQGPLVITFRWEGRHPVSCPVIVPRVLPGTLYSGPSTERDWTHPNKRECVLFVYIEFYTRLKSRTNCLKCHVENVDVVVQGEGIEVLI